MRLSTAVIKPSRLDDLRQALSNPGVPGMTVTAVKGFGRQKRHAEPCRGAEDVADFLPGTKIEGAAAPDMALRATETIAPSARTGKIFVCGLGQAVRIRAGETGASAL